MEVKMQKVGKIGKKDRELYFVAVVNNSGNVVTAASFLTEVDAESTAEMFKSFLNHDAIPFMPYEEMLNMTDRFYKKLADDENPLDDEPEQRLYEMPTSRQTYEKFCQQMATQLKRKLAEN